MQEGVGVLSVNISRTGNLEQSVDVVCYTEAHTASRGEDFRMRPNSARSRVVFSPFQTMAQCQVEIVDDILHESKEQFLVHLGDVRGRATVDTTTSPLCVYLIFDINDGEHSHLPLTMCGMPSLHRGCLLLSSAMATTLVRQIQFVKAVINVCEETHAQIV